MGTPLATANSIDVGSLIAGYGDRLLEFAMGRPTNDAKINLLVGSVRSGKTWALHGKIISLSVNYPIRGLRILTGQTKDTVYKNVLRDLFEIVGGANYHYNRSSGELWLYGTQWHVIGAMDEGSEKLIRGATVGSAVCDEVVLMPKGFFQMLLSRMSPPGSRLYGSTNPDQPLHWLKTEYIDDTELNRRKLVRTVTVTMDDNPNLTEDFKSTMRALYKGLFYQRFILGQWVMAEGGIYRDAWSEDLLYDELPATVKNSRPDRWISNDYGTSHPHVYLEFWDDGDTVWCDREWIWDSAKKMQQKTDRQYADDLVEFMGQNDGCQVIVPPEALSFRQELVNRGIWVTKADNEVQGGIQTVASMMVAKKLRVNRRCIHLRRGIETHVWDPNTAKRGLEEPLKDRDDECDALRYALASKIAKWRFSG